MYSLEMAMQGCDLMHQHLRLLTLPISRLPLACEPDQRTAGNSRAKFAGTVLFLFPIYLFYDSRLKKLVHIPPFVFTRWGFIRVDILNIDIQEKPFCIHRSGIPERRSLLLRYVDVDVLIRK